MAQEIEIIYGLHAVKHALTQHPETVLEVQVLEGRRPGGRLAQILRLAQQHGISVTRQPGRTLDRLTDGAVHQGLLARCRPHAEPVPAANLDQILAGIDRRPALLLVLDGIQDPHNLGACLRTANAAGVDAVIIPRDRAAPVNATVRKVASGAAEATPVVSVTNIARCLRQLKQAGVWILGTGDEAGSRLYDLDLSVPLALVMGAEGAGLRANTRKHCDFLAYLPMLGTVESLNVAVAAGVCLYEVVRQRQNGGVSAG
jgi:23S rRNA (guanosine2251-2'-O)-methyltransferase